MSKFDKVYNEALVNIGTNPQPTQPIGNSTSRTQLDISKLNMLSQKLAKSKGTNQPVNLTPDELEALSQLLGGSSAEAQTTDTDTDTDTGQTNGQNPSLDNVQKQQTPNPANRPLI